VRSRRDSIYWQVFLGCELRRTYLCYLPKEAVNQRVEYIQQLYQRTDDQIEEQYGRRPDKYLSESEMNRYLRPAN